MKGSNPYLYCLKEPLETYCNNNESYIGRRSQNWLPRRVMSAWRIAGVVHAMEGWTEHECGYTMSNIDQVWKATLRHGFQPVPTPTPCGSM